MFLIRARYVYEVTSRGRYEWPIDISLLNVLSHGHKYNVYDLLTAIPMVQKLT